MPIVRSQYSRTASRDARGAMAMALQRHLFGLTFYNAGGTFQFSEIFDEWPSYNDKYVPPAACVLPSEWKYADALFSPTLLEDTWEVYGEPGFGLYKLSEVNVDFEISIRTTSTIERSQIIQGIEESFRAENLLMDDVNGARYGILLPLPEYYSLQGRFSLMSAKVIDDEDRAVRENRDAIMVISAACAQVTVGPVKPLNLTVRIDYNCEDLEP